MTANATSFAPKTVTIDADQLTDGVLRIFKSGSPEPIVVLKADGSILAGNGSVPPVAVAGGTPALIVSGIAPPNLSEVSTSVVAGDTNTQAIALGASTAAVLLDASANSKAATVNAFSDGTTPSVTVAAAGDTLFSAASTGVVRTIGFFGVTPVIKQTATDLATVITALRNLGLIV